MSNSKEERTSSSKKQGRSLHRESSETNEEDNLRQFRILLTPAYAEFSKIIDGLYLTGVGGMTLDNFRINKITNIINCTHEAPDYVAAGLECYRISVDDSPNENISAYFDSGSDKIAAILSKGGRAVVHCVAGVSRSATIVISYLIKHQKMSLHDAFNLVQSRRRVIRPNNGFFKQLIEFEKKILGKNSVQMANLQRDDVQIEVPDFFEKEHRKLLILETFKAKACSLKKAATASAKAETSAASSTTKTTVSTKKPCSIVSIKTPRSALSIKTPGSTLSMKKPCSTVSMKTPGSTMSIKKSNSIKNPHDSPKSSKSSASQLSLSRSSSRSPSRSPSPKLSVQQPRSTSPSVASTSLKTKSTKTLAPDSVEQKTDSSIDQPPKT